MLILALTLVTMALMDLSMTILIGMVFKVVWVGWQQLLNNFLFV